MKDAIFFSKKLAYLMLVTLISATAKPVGAEVAFATDSETSINSLPAESSRDEEIGGEANSNSMAIVPPPIPQQIPCDSASTSPELNRSICSATQLEQVPRTLAEAGFSDQPIASPRLTAQTAPPSPNAPPEPPLSLRVLPRVGANFTTGPGIGYESSYGSVEGFVPLFQQPGQNLGFLQGRALLSTEDARLGGNLVLGYRSYSEQSDRIWGGYLSYDFRDTGNSTFNQVGLGVESLGETFDFRANGYLPVGETRQQTDENSFNGSSVTAQDPTFQGNRLAIGNLNQFTRIDRRFEAAMTGVDAEAGIRIARIGETGSLRGYGGLYYYDAPEAEGTVGVRGRLEARPNDNFQVGLSLQSDDRFGTNVVLSVGASIPGTRPRGARREDEVVARLGEGVTRQENIVVDQQSETQITRNSSPIFAINPATNQPYLFQHVALGETGGNGTFENPFGLVQPALNATRSDGNDIVYVQPGSNPGIPAFTIPDRVQILSTAPRQILPTVQRGNVQLPLSGAEVLPTILPSGSNIPSVTLGNNTTISGFAMNNATTVGIGNEASDSRGTNPISDVTIRDNQIAGAGNGGIRLTEVTGAINLSNNTITNTGAASGGDAIAVVNTSGQADINITGNNQITNNNGAGITFLLDNDAQATGTISGNTISGNAGNGMTIALNDNAAGSAQLNNLRISENAISGNNNSGIFFDLNDDARINNLTIADSQITNNGTGIFIQLSGNLEATVAISGNTISGNAGTGISALTFDDSTLRLLIDSNPGIRDNQGAGISWQALGNSNLFATVSNNTLTNNQTDPGDSGGTIATANFVAQSLASGRVCLNLANNTSINPNPAGADFSLFIEDNAQAQFSFDASGNTPSTINLLLFAPSFPPASPNLFTPLGDCPVPSSD